MYLSLNCLKDFIKIPNKIGATEIADLLTMHTVEVESWRLQADNLKQVVVAKVLTVKPHPNADRLRLAKVDIKSGTLDIVCGADNLIVGQKVAVALVGAKLPNGLEIKETVIRGETSFGMICAEDELGLGSDHEGILVLSDDAKIGQELSAYLALDDTIFEIDNKSLSNRGDLWGHYGLARELSVLLKLPLKSAITNFNEDLLINKIQDKIEVKLEEKNICSRYLAVKIDNLKIVESPVWLKNRLFSLGLKPVNAIVDITNYVMFELGQPLHVFDAQNIKKISIRLSNKDESIETLDGKERLLPEKTIVISSNNEAIAIAGVMGGLRSGVNENTKSVILEAATFDPVLVRKTSQALNLRTEASIRFEKSLDPNLPIIAWQRSWQLIKEIIPEAELSTDLVDIFPEPPIAKEISFDFSWLKDRMGYDLSRKEVSNILERLGFKVGIEKNIFTVVVPSWRAVKDVSSKEDILEEVLRIIGYNKIRSNAPKVAVQFNLIDKERILEQEISNILSFSANMNEVYNYSFVGESSLSKLNLNGAHYLRLLNPLNNNHTFLRQNLLVGLISNARLNQANYNEFSLYELGRVFLPVAGVYYKNYMKSESRLPYQGKRIGLLVANSQSIEAFNQLKGIIKLLFSTLSPKYLLEFTVPEDSLSWGENKMTVKIIWQGMDIGYLAIVNREVANNFGLKIQVAVAEINFQEVFTLCSQISTRLYEPISRFPPAIRDICFVVNEKVLYNEFWKELINFSPLLTKVELFDVYQGENLPADSKSWAFHLSYQDQEKTLTSTEIEKIQNDLVNYLSDKFEAKLRAL
ncbi:MAG: phenylalanine--tRNA ligase subunit beta [Clostridia bacterium]|nr:phenylalanine--tRNA ligase subunit beta [Clostridia bacterium]